jgi:hypothetical protein
VATIAGAQIAAGHDGTAVLIVKLEFESGRTSDVALDTDAGLRLMRHCGATQVSELVGHSWRGILEVATCSI